ncbi:hypothetical protein LTR85_002241 [Meristemomyces frigidus]|nr:hypothetical protein LTR85_002241 [Meristemomyces frigidus]
MHQSASNSTHASDTKAAAEQGAGDSISACHKVFNISELAETIFLELSMHDALVNIQRTCRSWRDNVEASLPIQQALFFKPISTSRLHFFKSADRNGQKRRRWAETEYGPDSQLPVEHPLITSAYWDRHKHGEAREWAEASWRRQLLTQPPIGSLTLFFQGSPAATTIQPPESSIRMGDLEQSMHGAKLEFMIGWSSWRTSCMDDTLHFTRSKMLERASQEDRDD